MVPLRAVRVRAGAAAAAAAFVLCRINHSPPYPLASTRTHALLVHSTSVRFFLDVSSIFMRARFMRAQQSAHEASRELYVRGTGSKRPAAAAACCCWYQQRSAAPTPASTSCQLHASPVAAAASSTTSTAFRDFPLPTSCLCVPPPASLPFLKGVRRR